MQAWQRKAVVDGVKSIIPMKGALRAAYRAVKPYETNSDNDGCLIVDTVAQIRTLMGAGYAVADKTVVEIGTGWKPVLPLLYAMCGAKQVITVDQERLLDAHTFRRAAQFIEASSDKTEPLTTAGAVRRPLRLPYMALPTMSLPELLAASHIDYRAPFKFQQLPSETADLIVSRDVWEHIPERLLRSIIQESRRILKPGGVHCHTIDMTDHWEHGDKSITKVNFLQFDGTLWSLAGLNPQNFQNRLRRCEYVRLFEEAGFRVVAASGQPDATSLAALQAMRLCARYAGLPLEELAVLHTTIVAVAQ